MTLYCASRRAYSTRSTSGYRRWPPSRVITTRCSGWRRRISNSRTKSRSCGTAVRAPSAGGGELPDWYQQKLEGLLARVEAAIAPHFASGREDERKRAARVMWAGVHGIVSLSTADKLSIVTPESAGRLVDDLVATYMAGLSKA